MYGRHSVSLQSSLQWFWCGRDRPGHVIQRTLQCTFSAHGEWMGGRGVAVGGVSVGGVAGLNELTVEGIAVGGVAVGV